MSFEVEVVMKLFFGASSSSLARLFFFFLQSPLVAIYTRPIFSIYSPVLKTPKLNSESRIKSGTREHVLRVGTLRKESGNNSFTFNFVVSLFGPLDSLFFSSKYPLICLQILIPSVRRLPEVRLDPTYPPRPTISFHLP